MPSRSASAVREDVLFRLNGAPIFSGTLAVFMDDPDLETSPMERLGIVLDYAWDEDAQMHLVHFLVDGHVIRLSRGDIRLP